MRVIIAGSRPAPGFVPVLADIHRAVVNSGWWGGFTVVVSGTAAGVDRLGEEWAAIHHIPVVRFPAQWKTGRKAGLVRNVLMADNADALIAVWNGKSAGTRHMIDVARSKGLQVYVERLEED